MLVAIHISEMVKLKLIIRWCSDGRTSFLSLLQPIFSTLQRDLTIPSLDGLTIEWWLKSTTILSRSHTSYQVWCSKVTAKHITMKLQYNRRIASQFNCKVIRGIFYPIRSNMHQITTTETVHSIVIRFHEDFLRLKSDWNSKLFHSNTSFIRISFFLSFFLSSFHC